MSVKLVKPPKTCAHHPPLKRSESPEAAALWWDSVQLCAEAKRDDHLRWLARNDLFFLLVYILNRKHFLADERKAAWTFARCNEVQDDPNNHLDLWPREHFKSEIITFGLTIQDILNDPELTFGIFSHTRPMAKDFLNVIKLEFQNNELLRRLFDDIIWENPKYDCREAGVPWSVDEITVKRKGNPKESTIEAWGLTDGQPTGKRYRRLIYDDVVSRAFVSDAMVVKTTNEFSNSLLLTASDPPVFRYVATYQEIDDTTQSLEARGFGNVRKHFPVKDGTPVCFSDEKLAWFKQNLEPKVFALQILLDPAQAKNAHDMGFNTDWLEYYDEMPPRNGLNVYILVDPAGQMSESNSRYSLWVVGVGADRRARVLDGVWDNFDLAERWEILAKMVDQWEPLKVGYEKYGMQADTEHFRAQMKKNNYFFTIVELSNPTMSKDARIGQLIPWFRDRRVILPRKLIKRLKNGKEVDLIQHFINQEYTLWPHKKVKDMLDALARICDPALAVVYPRHYGAAGWSSKPDAVTNFALGGSGSWMSE